MANAIGPAAPADGDAAQARAVLEPHLGSRNGASSEACPSVRAESWLLDAMALDALAEHDDAAQALERALDIAEPAGCGG